RALLLGGLPDENLAVVADEQHRRHLHGADPEPEHLRPPVGVHGRSRVGRTEIHTQPVTHAGPSCPDGRLPTRKSGLRTAPMTTACTDRDRFHTGGRYRGMSWTGED